MLARICDANADEWIYYVQNNLRARFADVFFFNPHFCARALRLKTAEPMQNAQQYARGVIGRRVTGSEFRLMAVVRRARLVGHKGQAQHLHLKRTRHDLSLIHI